jgi:hypothetical protein
MHDWLAKSAPLMSLAALLANICHSLYGSNESGVRQLYHKFKATVAANFWKAGCNYDANTTGSHHLLLLLL